MKPKGELGTFTKCFLPKVMLDFVHLCVMDFANKLTPFIPARSIIVSTIMIELLCCKPFYKKNKSN